MIPCLFASDLHGSIPRYNCLFETILNESPTAVFLGGDLLPSFLRSPVDPEEFLTDFMRQGLYELKSRMAGSFPRIFVILGNDDPAGCEPDVVNLADAGLWEYIHGRNVMFAGYEVYGYACIPPTPFLNKDWERYDVSRFVDPGCVSPEEGFRSVPSSREFLHEHTIECDLNALINDRSLERSVFLLHTPPHKTHLDRAALDGRMVDHVPLDVHVGSIAVRRMIEERGPLLTLHGHIHESARLTGRWKDQIGRTLMFNASHDGEELSVIRFDLEQLANASRELIPVAI